MRYLKIYILIFVVLVWIFPIKIFGYFANPPDKYIRSMPFGAKDENTSSDENVIPPDLSQYPPSLSTPPDSLVSDQNDKTAPADSSNASAKNSSFPLWIILTLILIFIFISGLVFYKFKKYKKVV